MAELRVLILTNRFDLHADIVADKLAERGHRPFRLDLDRFPKDYDITLEYAGDRWCGGLGHRPTGDALAVAQVGAVWTRKAADFSYPSGELSGQEKLFADEEMEHILFSLIYGLDAFWMSHPRALRGAGWKGEQLLRAARLGFATPRSIITNRPDRLRAFRRAVGGEMIFKTLSSTQLASDQVAPDERVAGPLGTTRIGPEHDELIEAVTEAPCLFQALVAKQYEVRATVIGDQVFAAKISSQADARTALDYRDFSAEIPYEAITLPAPLAERCVRFVHSYGLTFGALDLIVTPDHEVVFLENNPVGQFLFVEELAPALDMTGAVADCLIAGLTDRPAS